MQVQDWYPRQADLLILSLCFFSPEVPVVVKYMGQQSTAAELKPIDHGVKCPTVG